MDSKPWYKFSFEIKLFVIFGKKNSETYYLLIMADLPPLFILATEVAMRIDTKCQKSIYTYVIK